MNISLRFSQIFWCQRFPSSTNKNRIGLITSHPWGVNWGCFELIFEFLSFSWSVVDCPILFPDWSNSLNLYISLDDYLEIFIFFMVCGGLLNPFFQDWRKFLNLYILLDDYLEIFIFFMVCGVLPNPLPACPLFAQTAIPQNVYATGSVWRWNYRNIQKQQC